MTDKNYDFVTDREYGQFPRLAPARQIKTRSISFENIRRVFNSFCADVLKKRLDHKVEQALTQGYKEDNFKTKLGKNANVIARLEEKIMILSGEEVPKNYVSRRAIRLRESMASNLTYNSNLMYTIGMENRDKVLNSGIADEKKTIDSIFDVKDDADVQKFPEEDKAAAIPVEESSDSVDVVPSALERQEIEGIINSSFSDAQKDATVDSNSSVSTEDVEKSSVDKNDVRGVVNDAFDAMDKGSDTADMTSSLNKGDIQRVVNDAFDAVSTEKTMESEQHTSLENADVRSVVNDAFAAMDGEKTSSDGLNIDSSNVTHENEAGVDTEMDKVVDKLKVSRNNSSVVNASHFDDDGNRRERHRKYNYVPMTDEEIRQSQIKLGFDEHGNIVDNGVNTPKQEVVSTAKVIGNFIAPGSIPNVTINDAFVPAVTSPPKHVREIPVVVPDRDDSSYDLGVDDGKSIFEVVDQSSNNGGEEYRIAEPAVSDSSKTASDMSIDDYNALKEKILLLQQQKRETYQKRLDAQRAAEVAEAEANAARKLYEKSQENYQARMQKLEQYMKSLEADCDENVRGVALAEDDVRKSNDYVQTRRQLIDSHNQIISEIDSMIGSADSQDSVARGR